MSTRVRDSAHSAIGVIVVLFAWEALTRVFEVPEVFVPGPLAVAVKIAAWISDGSFWLDAGSSIGRVLAAFLLSMVLALPISLLAYRSAAARPTVQTITDFFRYIPVPALVPLTILLFGVGELSKIVLLFLGTFFQLILLFSDDLKEIPQNYNDLFYCLRLSRKQRIIRIIRASGPRLFDSCRVTVGWCWTYVIIAELVAAEHGIGHAIKEFQRFSDSQGVYAGIVIMAAIGFLTDLLFRNSARHIFPYQLNLQSET